MMRTITLRWNLSLRTSEGGPHVGALVRELRDDRQCESVSASSPLALPLLSFGRHDIVA
jgi:hypothetical protein